MPLSREIAKISWLACSPVPPGPLFSAACHPCRCSWVLLAATTGGPFWLLITRRLCRPPYDFCSLLLACLHFSLSVAPLPPLYLRFHKQRQAFYYFLKLARKILLYSKPASSFSVFSYARCLIMPKIKKTNHMFFIFKHSHYFCAVSLYAQFCARHKECRS